MQNTDVIYLQSNYILTIDLTDLMISKEAVTCSWAVFYYWSDSTLFKKKAELPVHVLVKSNSSLQWPANSNSIFSTGL